MVEVLAFKGIITEMLSSWWFKKIVSKNLRLFPKINWELFNAIARYRGDLSITVIKSSFVPFEFIINLNGAAYWVFHLIFTSILFIWPCSEQALLLFNAWNHFTNWRSKSNLGRHSGLFINWGRYIAYQSIHNLGFKWSILEKILLESL